MKKIEAIIRPTKVRSVCAALEKVGHCGVTVSEVEGHGNHGGVKETVRDKVYKVDLLGKARVEVVTRESEMEKIIDAIREAAYTGKIGDGKIFIHPIDDAIRIRTAERGEKAL